MRFFPPHAFALLVQCERPQVCIADARMLVLAVIPRKESTTVRFCIFDASKLFRIRWHVLKGFELRF